MRGRAAIFKFGSTAIAKAKNYTMSISEDVIKDYSMDGVDPEVLAPGDRTTTFTVEKLWVDSIYVKLLLNQTYAGVTAVFCPAGISAGEMTITLSNVILSRWNMTADKDGVVLEGVSGEGKSPTIGVAPP